MRRLLNEKQWRQFLALEAKEPGNIVLVSREAGVSKNTIKVGRRELGSAHGLVTRYISLRSGFGTVFDNLLSFCLGTATKKLQAN
jgi:hypothetical protein